MLKLEFATDNAAFEDGDKADEVARILRDITMRVERASFGGLIHDINGNRMAMAIAGFTDTRVWRSRDDTGNRPLVFCGLASDTQLAGYLIDSLTAFVQAELANYLAVHVAPKGQRRLVINGFVGGATRRIADRLNELRYRSATTVQANGNGRALVSIKHQLIEAKVKELGLHLRSGRRSSKRADGASYAAGKAAGDRASFGRPVGSGGGVAGYIGRS